MLESFFNKVADLRPATLLKTKSWHKYFPVNLEKFLKATFLKDNPGANLNSHNDLLDLITAGRLFHMKGHPPNYNFFIFQQKRRYH